MSTLAHLGEIYAYRELLRNLVVRDLKVRYRNSILGFFWALGNPLLMMFVFTVVFTILIPTNIAHFPVFILTGLLPWNFFTASVMGSIFSIVGNAHLIRKVYFPREILPMAVVFANLVNFVLALSILFVLTAVFRIPFTAHLLFLPLIIIAQVLFTLGVAFFLSAVNVFFRDTAQIVDVGILALFFLTPVFYPIEQLPRDYVLLGLHLDVWRLMHILNPMASLIAAYRVVLYGHIDGAPPGPLAMDFFLRTLMTAILVLIIGYMVFARASRSFGEEV